DTAVVQNHLFILASPADLPKPEWSGLRLIPVMETLDKLIQDVRFAFRGYRRAPAFPLAAIATLALGIGATTAIFSTLNAVLLKPLPYPQPDNLYSIRTTLTDGRVTTGMLSHGEISRLNGTTSTIVRA